MRNTHYTMTPEIQTRTLARQSHKAVALGIASDCETKQAKAIWDAGNDLLKAIHGEPDVARALEWSRNADNYASAGAKSLLENSPEMYGVSPAHLRTRYGHVYANPKPERVACDCELSETDAALVAAGDNRGRATEGMIAGD